MSRPIISSSRLTAFKMAALSQIQENNGGTVSILVDDVLSMIDEIAVLRERCGLATQTFELELTRSQLDLLHASFSKLDPEDEQHKQLQDKILKLSWKGI